jgi:hypothetical protein
MKKGVIVSLSFLVIAALAIALVYGFSKKNPVKHEIIDSRNTGFAVVELFTSEGCSSCPPADAAVAKLLSEKSENVYILSFHVDYWNRLGWNDPFSQAAFSARQRNYAQAFSLENIYTPQVVVNGKEEFVGSDATKLNAAVENGLNEESLSDFKISTSKNGNTVTVRYTFSKSHAALLNIALVQPEATTVIKRGENSGKTLHHVNIVRAFHTADVKENGYFTIEIPADLSGIPLQVIAYTQSKENYIVSGADQKNLSIDENHY